MHLSRFVVLLLSLVPVACTSSGERGSKVPMEVESEPFVGSLWTGPIAGPEPAVDEAPWWLRLRIGYASAPPSGDSEHVASRLDQVFVERAGRPLATRSELAAGVLATATTPTFEIGIVDRIDPIWAGTTAVWLATPELGAADPPAVRWRLAQFEVTRPGDAGAQPELALVFEGEVVPRGEDEESGDHPVQPGPPVVQREHVVLPPAAFEEGEIRRFFLPAPRRAVPRGGFAVEIARIAPPASADSADALDRARAALARSIAAVRENASPVTADESFRFESGTALPALEQPRLQRSALVFLAQVSRAPLAGDLALDAEPAALASFAASLAPVVRGQGRGEERGEARGEAEGGELPSLGWALERAAFAWLTTAAQDEKHPLPKELSALLVAHAGELGRFPDLCCAAVNDCDGLAALGERLVQENRIFLEDADPSARLRAFEWLHDRGAAPEGFDPLGPLADRRAALERSRETTERSKEAAGEAR